MQMTFTMHEHGREHVGSLIMDYLRPVSTHLIITDFFGYLCTYCTFSLSEVYSHFSFPIWEHKREPVNLQFCECSCENGLRHSPRPLALTPWVGDAERQGTLEDNPVTQRLQDDINTDAGLLTDTVTGRLWYK